MLMEIFDLGQEIINLVIAVASFIVGWITKKKTTKKN